LSSSYFKRTLDVQFFSFFIFLILYGTSSGPVFKLILCRGFNHFHKEFKVDQTSLRLSSILSPLHTIYLINIHVIHSYVQLIHTIKNQSYISYVMLIMYSQSNSITFASNVGSNFYFNKEYYIFLCI